MSLLDRSLSPIRRLMRPGSSRPCFVCRQPIHPSEERVRLRDEVVVHRRCATYRMRNRQSPPSRLGFPG